MPACAATRCSVRDALEKGGGRCAEGGSLGRGVTHVVCQPEAALQWLSMGVAVVSPQWVLQSLRAGKQQRCLAVSADASRHLPAASVASSGEGAEAGAAAGSGSIPPRRPTQEQQPQLSSELLQSKEARQRVLSQLAGSGGGEAAAADAAAGAHQQAATPAELLAGVVWSVLEPPAAATMEGQRAPPQPEEGG